MTVGRGMYQVSFTYDFTTISLGVLANSYDEAQNTAEDIAADEWGYGVRKWNEYQVERIGDG